jgi:hypothetical protein
LISVWGDSPTHRLRLEICPIFVRIVTTFPLKLPQKNDPRTKPEYGEPFDSVLEVMVMVQRIPTAPPPILPLK